jgi:hypothetical protein
MVMYCLMVCLFLWLSDLVSDRLVLSCLVGVVLSCLVLSCAVLCCLVLLNSFHMYPCRTLDCMCASEEERDMYDLIFNSPL